MSPLALNYDSKSSSEDLYSMSSQSPEMVFEEQPKSQTTNQLSMDDNENGILQMHYQKFVPIKPKVENQGLFNNVFFLLAVFIPNIRNPKYNLCVLH